MGFGPVTRINGTLPPVPGICRFYGRFRGLFLLIQKTFVEFFKKQEYSIVEGFNFPLKNKIRSCKMKKSSAFAGLFAGILALLTFSCESLDGLVQAPTAEVKSVSIAGLDLDGISFNFIVSRQGMQIRFTLPSRFHLQKILTACPYRSKTFRWTWTVTTKKSHRHQQGTD